MTTTEVATTTDHPPSLAQLIARMQPEIARALPKHITPERMARIAVTAVRQTPKLAECTPDSVLGSLMTSAQLGLEPNTPLGEAYLIPFRVKNKATDRHEMVCQFIPGYRGLLKLALQSPVVAKARARAVYENDEFDYEFGLNERLEHKPARGERGRLVAVYAYVKFKDGESDFDVMSIEDVAQVRRRSRSADNGPWVTDFDAMAIKSVFRRLAKWIPLATELSAAVAMDESVRTDVGALVDARPEFVDGDVLPDARAIQSGPGRGGGDEQREGAEPSSGTTNHAPAADQAPAPEAPEVLMISAAQSKRLHALLGAEGLSGSTKEQRAAKLEWLSANVGRPVTSSSELTDDEAGDLIAVLEHAQAGGEQPEGEQPEGEQR